MEISVAKKLDALLKVQELDSKLDSIKKILGDLPEEVQDLEDDIIGFETKTKRLKAEKKAFEQAIVESKNNIKDHKKLIKKYDSQQMNVRNNREFEAVTREIENQELDIKLDEKLIRETDLKIQRKESEITRANEELDSVKEDLKGKQEELKLIAGESEEDKARLMKDRDKKTKNIDENLYKAYTRIRSNARNGLAVVKVSRNACGGCFHEVPPQRQVDIRERKKVIVCEHCGRIFADAEIFVEPEKKRKTTKRKPRKKIEAKK